MSAADLPEMRREGGPVAMARALVTYIADPRAVRRAVKEEFGLRVPALATIKDLRARHVKSLEKHPEKPFKAHEGYYPADAAERASETSRRFVEALERERALSVERARAMGALDSPALRQPAIVDKAWDREAEAAWRQNGELR